MGASVRTRAPGLHERLRMQARQRAAINEREKYDGQTQRNSQGARADRRRACRNPQVIRARYETRSLAVMGEGRMGRVAVGLSVPVAMTRPANRKEATPMINFLLQHQFWVAVALYWIFSSAISALPEPNPNGSPGYHWLYRFLHTTAGNLTTAFNRLPGMKPFILLLLVPLMLSTTACAALDPRLVGVLPMNDAVIHTS